MNKVTKQLLLVLRMMANEMLRIDCRGYQILCDCFVSGRHDVWRVSVHHHACMFQDAFSFLTAYNVQQHVHHYLHHNWRRRTNTLQRGKRPTRRFLHW